MDTMKTAGAALALAGALAAAGSNAAFAAAYLKFEGIKGEAAASQTGAARARAGAVVLDSYSLGRVGAGACTGVAGPGQISVGAAPGAAMPAADRGLTRQMTLDIDTSAGALHVQLEDVLISSASAGRAPAETMSLNFARATWSYANCQAGLLLPAVQKVREAAYRPR